MKAGKPAPTTGRMEVRYPPAWASIIDEARHEGESGAAFARVAIQNEIKRRLGKDVAAAMPDARGPGRPWPDGE